MARVVRRAGPLLLVEGGVRRLPAMHPGRLLRFDGVGAPTALTLFAIDGLHVAIDTTVDASASGGQFGRGRMQSSVDVVPLTRRGHDGPCAEIGFPSGPNLVGRVLNGRGQTVDGGSPLPPGTPFAPLFASVPTQKERQVISEGLPTGITAIDALTPIGLGQSMLFTGPEGAGKSSLLRDTIISSIGVAVGGERRDWATPIAHCVRCDVSGSALEHALDAAPGAAALRRETTTVVPAGVDAFAPALPSASPAALGDDVFTTTVEEDLEAYLATLGAVAVAEGWRNSGAHAVVALDGGLAALGRLLRRSLSLVDAHRYEAHCVDAGIMLRGGEGEVEVRREWSLQRQPAHRHEARGVFASLLERSARLLDTDGGVALAAGRSSGGGGGGGSLTMLVAVEDAAAAAAAGPATGAAEEGEGEGQGEGISAAPSRQSASGVADSAGGEWLLPQFVAAGHSAKEIARLSVLVERGIPLTSATLSKIGVALPHAPLRGEEEGAAASSAGAALDASAAAAAAASASSSSRSSRSSRSSSSDSLFDGLSSDAHLEELKSLADGHIVLCPLLFAAGQLPALDASKSITRIGIGSDTTKHGQVSGNRSDADEEKRVNVIKDPRPHALRLIAAPARIALSAAQDHAASGAQGSELRGGDSEEVWRARSAARLAVWRAALSQPECAPLSLSDQVVLLFTAAMGHFESDLQTRITPGGGFELMNTRLSLLRGGRDAPVRALWTISSLVVSSLRRLVSFSRSRARRSAVPVVLLIALQL